MGLQAEIRKKFSGFELEVSLHTEEGILGILGASGSGKSMTLKCIAGIETPDEGRIVLNGRVLFDSKEKINLSPQKRKVGYLFQNYALFPNMTVEKNIGAGMKGSRGEKEERIREMIRLFRLDGLEKRYPSQLSGGQQQRVALARILAYEPDVIMLDEPFSALDYYLKEQLQFQVKEVLKSYAGDVLLVTHSRDEVYRFCQNSMILNQGRVVTSGATEQLFRRPENVTAARLTGCKNISRLQKLDSRRVLAKDWGLVLTLPAEPDDEIRFVGIRAHQLFLIPEEGGDARRQMANGNEFICRWEDTLKQPFEWDILLRAADQGPAGTEPAEEPGCTAAGRLEPLWWKLDVEQTGILEGKRPGEELRIGAAPESILLLKE